MTSSLNKLDHDCYPTTARQTGHGMYGFLATLFRGAPGAELIEQFLDPEFKDALSSAGLSLLEDFQDQDLSQYLDELELEYTRLFLGPGRHISPHESVHREDEDSRLYGKATIRVLQFYETAGFRLQPDYHGLPDHISAELEFMQTLGGWETQAGEKGDTELAMKCLELQTQFLHEHLLKWIPNFCRKVMEEAELPFYQEIAGLMSDFMEMEKEYLPMTKKRISLEDTAWQTSDRGIHRKTD